MRTLMRFEKQERIVNILLLIFLVLFIFRESINYINSLNTQETIIVDTDTTSKNRDLRNLYTIAINHLKQKEGLCKRPIVSCSGQITIGYGHVVKKDEKFTTMNENEATILLKKDLDKAIRFIENNTDLRYNQSLAIGMLAFNVGTGRCMSYIKSDSLLYGNNIQRMKNYCHYHNASGRLITSKPLKERREFELLIYNWYNE